MTCKNRRGCWPERSLPGSSFDLIETRKDLFLCLGSKTSLKFALRKSGHLWRPGYQHLKGRSKAVGIIWHESSFSLSKKERDDPLRK